MQVRSGEIEKKGNTFQKNEARAARPSYREDSLPVLFACNFYLQIMSPLGSFDRRQNRVALFAASKGTDVTCVFILHLHAGAHAVHEVITVLNHSLRVGSSKISAVSREMHDFS